MLEDRLDEFWARPLRDLGKLKQLSERELDSRLQKLGAKWHTTPFRHQKVGILSGLQNPTCYFLYDAGTGKTLIPLSILLSRIQEIEKCLVLVPGVANIGAWLEEIKRHAPELSAIGLTNMASEDKRRALMGDERLVITTYMGWLKLIGIRFQIIKKGKRKIKQIVVDDPQLAVEVENRFQMVVWDEANAIKNRKSLSFIAAARMVRSTPRRYCLSGTPFHKDPTDLWSQFYVLDEGHALGEGIGIFQTAFCTRKKNHFSGFFDFPFDNSKREDFQTRLGHCALRYSAAECMDLPAVTGGMLSGKWMMRPVPFPKENLDYYAKVLAELRGKRNAEIIKNVYTRLRQLTAGFIPIKEGGIRRNIYFDRNPKLEALLELLEEIPQDAKVIVFNEFISSGDRISEEFTEKKISHVRLFSGTADKVGTMEKFKADKKVRVLLGSRSLCYGLNLQLAHHMVIFESPDSTILRDQLEHRIVRMGQTEHSFIWDLVVEKSVDVRILDSLQKGKDLFDFLMESEDPYQELLT